MPLDPSNPYADLVPTGKTILDPGNPYADLVPAKQPAPHTTAPGIAASLARGVAPYAAGAAIGAGIGAPFLGIGAVPGAAAGIGATILGEVGGDIYNWLGGKLGAPHVVTPQEASDKALDVLGIRRPSTTLEHSFEALGGLALPGIGLTRGMVDIGTMVLENRAGAAERFVQRAYEKAIRPTVVGRRTGRQITKAEENVVSALSSIIDNKASLRLVDKNGREIIGRTPRTLDEFVQAIAQTKRPVFDMYDHLASDAEGLGVKIDTAPVVAELRKFAADPSFALPKFDMMRKYAIGTADILEKQGTMQPTVAQKMIRNLNEGLTAFYRASSPEAASRAAVDDLIANQLRGSVDVALENAGLPGWLEARSVYGALKAIESEVMHRAVVFGRRDPSGGLVGRLGSIATYEELARFAMSFDPSALASAMAIRGGRAWLELWHGPNHAIRRMFNVAERYRKSSGAPSVQPTRVIPPGLQPPRPSGPGQALSGAGASMGIVRGGSTALPLVLPPAKGVRPILPDEFLSVLGGGKVQ